MGKPKSQIQKFRDAARKIEADESEERFDAALKGVANVRRKDEAARDHGRSKRTDGSGKGEDRS